MQSGDTNRTLFIEYFIDSFPIVYFRRDLTIMRAICKCAMYVVPQLYWLSLTDCIDEFSQIMDNQVTF